MRHDGYLSLLAWMLKSTVEQLNARDRHRRRQALTWLFEDDPTEHPLSFDGCCSVLGMDPAKIRQHVERAIRRRAVRVTLADLRRVAPAWVAEMDTRRSRAEISSLGGEAKACRATGRTRQNLRTSRQTADLMGINYRKAERAREVLDHGHPGKAPRQA